VIELLLSYDKFYYSTGFAYIVFVLIRDRRATDQKKSPHFIYFDQINSNTIFLYSILFIPARRTRGPPTLSVIRPHNVNVLDFTEMRRNDKTKENIILSSTHLIHENTTGIR